MKTETFTDNTLLDELTRLIDRAKYYGEPVTLEAIERLKFDAENTLACLAASTEEAVGDAEQEGFNEGKERMFDVVFNALGDVPSENIDHCDCEEDLKAVAEYVVKTMKGAL